MIQDSTFSRSHVREYGIILGQFSSKGSAPGAVKEPSAVLLNTQAFMQQHRTDMWSVGGHGFQKEPCYHGT